MRFTILVLLFCLPILLPSWGFFMHPKINQLAVFTLPVEMIGFYKDNIDYITNKAVNPDKRRYVLKNEAVRHYIDLDAYGDSAMYKMPKYWNGAVEKFTEDTLLKHGIVPYHIHRMTYRLIDAFMKKDSRRILKISTDMGHYIADANVPLHTTSNYNGQLTGQFGIHALWESRLPELFFNQYDLFTGKSEYIEDLQEEIWRGVISAHLAVDSVLLFEKQLTSSFSPSKKYSFEDRGYSNARVYSYSFSKAYHKKLNGMVERRLRSSIRMVGNFWFSCWVKAGQPDLTELNKIEVTKDSVYVIDPLLKKRLHESE